MDSIFGAPFYFRFVTVLLHMGTFLVLFLLLKRFLFDPIMNTVTSRRGELESGHEELDEKQDELTEKIQEFEHRMEKEREQANQKMQEIVSEGMERRTEITSGAHEEALEILEQAREQIQKEKEAAKEDLKQHTIEIARLIAGRVADVDLDEQELSPIAEEIR